MGAQFYIWRRLPDGSGKQRVAGPFTTEETTQAMQRLNEQDTRTTYYITTERLCSVCGALASVISNRRSGNVRGLYYARCEQHAQESKT